MTEVNHADTHPTVAAARQKWCHAVHWLSQYHFVLAPGEGSILFKKFDSLAKALRRAGVHYFEYDGLVIWELSDKPGEYGEHVNQFLLNLPRVVTPSFLLPAKQLTPDELHRLNQLNRAAIVGKMTPLAATTATSTKAKHSQPNRRRKANQRAKSESDTWTTSAVQYCLGSLGNTNTNTTALGGAYYVGDNVATNYQAPVLGELGQMRSATNLLHSPHSPSESSSTDTWSALSMHSDCEGFEDSFPSFLSLDLDSFKFQFQN